MELISKVLTEHHQVIRDLFKDVLDSPEQFDKLNNHLTIHHKNEEKFLYDLLEQEDKTRHDALEAVEEHHVIEMLLQELNHFPKDHERWKIKLEVLQEYTLHHLDEEEDDVFPQIDSVLDEEKRAELGRKFNELKDKQLSIL
ncbi:MAG: hemerythrin domain-containing protein [Desulfocapsaceae bacterium]|nr:hemerythrin domain-containing protein [Desulfocapsaceae bacterium]